MGAVPDEHVQGWVVAGRRTLARRTSRGAAAVEGALVSAVVLVPLLMGTLFFGYYFWQAQKVQNLDLEIPQNSISGIYCSDVELVARVKDLLGPNLTGLAGDLGVPVSAVNLVGNVVQGLPVDVGVAVRLSLDVDVLNGVLGGVPYVNNVVKELTVRLQNVAIQTGSGGCGG